MPGTERLLNVGCPREVPCISRAGAEASRDRGGSSQTLRVGNAWRRGVGGGRAEPQPSMPAASAEDREG